jgi:hypothetical protein
MSYGPAGPIGAEEFRTREEEDFAWRREWERRHTALERAIAAAPSRQARRRLQQKGLPS